MKHLKDVSRNLIHHTNCSLSVNQVPSDRALVFSLRILIFIGFLFLIHNCGKIHNSYLGSLPVRLGINKVKKIRCNLDGNFAWRERVFISLFLLCPLFWLRLQPYPHYSDNKPYWTQWFQGGNDLCWIQSLFPLSYSPLHLAGADPRRLIQEVEVCP